MGDFPWLLRLYPTGLFLLFWARVFTEAMLHPGAENSWPARETSYSSFMAINFYYVVLDIRDSLTCLCLNSRIVRRIQSLI